MKRTMTRIMQITTLIASVALICFFLIRFEYVKVESVWGAIGSVLLLVVGCLSMMYLHIIFHETGHLLGGLVGGFKFHSFRIGDLEIIKNGGKLKMRFKRLSGYGGVCQMVPTSGKNLEKGFYQMVAGGLVMSGVVTAMMFFVAVAPIFMKVNRYIYMLIASGFPISLYLLVTNLSTTASVRGMTDGAYLSALRKKLPTGIATIKILILQSVLMSGTRPRDVSLEIVEDFPILADNDINNLIVWSMQYTCYLDRGNFEMATKMSRKIENNIDLASEIHIEPLLTDVFYNYAAVENNIEKATEIYDKIKNYVESAQDISKLRMEITYEVVIKKDVEKARKLAKDVDFLKSNFMMKGVAEMEEELIEKMLEQKEAAKKQ